MASIIVGEKDWANWLLVHQDPVGSRRWKKILPDRYPAVFLVCSGILNPSQLTFRTRYPPHTLSAARQGPPAALQFDPNPHKSRRPATLAPTLQPSPHPESVSRRPNPPSSTGRKTLSPSSLQRLSPSTQILAMDPVVYADLAELFVAAAEPAASTEPAATHSFIDLHTGDEPAATAAIAQPAATHSARDCVFFDLTSDEPAAATGDPFAASGSCSMALPFSRDDLVLPFGTANEAPDTGYDPAAISHGLDMAPVTAPADMSFANHFHMSSDFEVALSAHRASVSTYKASMISYKASLDAFTHLVPVSAHLATHLTSFNSHLSSLSSYEALLPVFTTLDNLDAGGCSRGSPSQPPNRLGSSSERYMSLATEVDYEALGAVAAYHVNDADLEEVIEGDNAPEELVDAYEVNHNEVLVFHNIAPPPASVPLSWSGPSFKAYKLEELDFDNRFPVNVDFPQFENVTLQCSCFGVRGRMNVQELMDAIVAKLARKRWVPPPEVSVVLRTEQNEDVPADVLLGQVLLRDMSQSCGLSLTCYFV